MLLPLLLPLLLGAATAMLPSDAPARPLAPGTITIAPTTGEVLSAEVGRVFDEAVQRAVMSAGFTLLPGQDHGRYAARVMVTRSSRGVVASGRAPTPPPLASLGGAVSLSLPAGGSRFSELAVTKLTVTIARRSDGRAVWSGSAVTARASDSPSGSVDVIAQALASAVVAQFPYRADGPVSVP